MPLYARGWAKSLRSSYMAMVEQSFRPAFHIALSAHADEARVLQLDPDYIDAKLVVGTYQYVIGALPWGFKLLFGFAGITGSRSRGMDLLHDDFSRGPMTSLEAGTVISLFLRRESKYQEAIAVVRTLKSKYPHDFLFCLEEANLRKDNGEGMSSVAAYEQLLKDAAKPGYFPSSHLELAYFGMGEALSGQRHFADSAQAYERAAYTPRHRRRAQAPLPRRRRQNPRPQQPARPGHPGLPGRHRQRPRHHPGRHSQKAPEIPLPRLTSNNPPGTIFRCKSYEPLAVRTADGECIMNAYCSRCGQPLPPNARFCSACGTQVTGAPPLGYVPDGPPLLRPIFGRQFAGVCAAFARTYRWDISTVRILTVLGGVFLCPIVELVYLAAWIGIREELPGDLPTPQQY